MPTSWPVNEFRAYLRTLMDAAGIPDFAELSRLTGVNQSQFSNWQHGRSQPSHNSLRRIAPVLGVQAYALFEQAGLSAEGDQDARPDLTVWPREFHDLREVYERFAAKGRGSEVLDAVGTLTLGLTARIGKESQPTRRRRAG